MRTRTARLFFLLALLGAAASVAEDRVPVPGGPASVRRLFGLDPDRPDAAFFLDLHELLLFSGSEVVSWTSVEPRRRAAAFTSDVAEWRRVFGDPARFSAAPAGRQRCLLALDWLGFSVRDEAGELETSRRSDEVSLRRQSFLDALGLPTAEFLARLRAGEEVTVSAGEGAAPLPFGLAAWQETLADPALTAGNAFLYFVQNIRASRMLVALHGLDPETREGLRALMRDSRGRPLGWKIVYEEILEPFSRYPEALQLREGRFLLPGGSEALPVWESTFRVPSERASFLKVFYTADQEKGVYVVDTLQHLPEEEARELIYGNSSAGEEKAKRFRALYQSIDRSGRDYASTRRDPYDFAQLAPFLSDPPPLSLEASPGAELPRNDEELQRLLASVSAAPAGEEETWRRLLGPGDAGAAAFSAPRRFLFLSGLFADRPNLSDPGLALLLDRGFDRFQTSYAILAEFPMPGPELARRYIFTVDRLARAGDSREVELAAGLFQGYVVLLTELARVGSLEPGQAAELLSTLLDVSVFARAEAPAKAEAELFAWLSNRLLPAVRGGRPAGEELDADELLGRALGGRPEPVPVEWRGGRYRFDPAGDAAVRRRAFRETQSLSWISDLELLHREREVALAAAARGDLDAWRAACAELALGLRLPGPGGPSGSHDERIRRVEDRARDAAGQLAAISQAHDLAGVAPRVADLDALLAERHLEALLGHVYSIAAKDPADLYFQDPNFVARHSFRTARLRQPTSAFASTSLAKGERGGGSRVAGSLFELSEALGLLHADQLSYRSGAAVPTEEFRSGLVATIWRMSPARLDDASLEIVAASCSATRELARALAPFSAAERFEVWDGLARDLVPRSRLALLSTEGGSTEEVLDAYLSASDLYRIGRRLLRQMPTSSLPLPSARRARDVLAGLEKRLGPEGARQRLAEFGPLAEAYAGRRVLADIDMPPYERLAVYRRPHLLAERLYDLKIEVACRVAAAGLPAAVLPIVLPAALDAMLSRLVMAYPYDWGATTRAAADFSASDLEKILDGAVDEGRLLRDGDDPAGGS